MQCPKCRSTAFNQRPERTAQGYRRLRCLDCTNQFNERSGGLLNRTQHPSDVIALVVLWRLHYKLRLRDLAEMFLLRGIVFSYEAVRDWEAKLTPALAEELRRNRKGKVGRTWYVDGTYIRVYGHWKYLHRAIGCNIHVRSQRAGERVMASVSRPLTIKLRLKVNEAKSAVARPEERKFLEVGISNYGSDRRIVPKALDTFKAWIREQTRRTREISLSRIIEELTPYLIGFCQTPRVLTNLEAWIRRRLRSYLWQQWGNGRNRFKELRHRGVTQFRAAVAASSPTGTWRMSGCPAVQDALRNHHFDSLGLPRLYVPVSA